MLVLTRKLRQAVTLGDGITVTVLAIHGKQVRLGISAPQQVPIFRTDGRHLNHCGEEVLSRAIGPRTRSPAENASGVPRTH